MRDPELNVLLPALPALDNSAMGFRQMSTSGQSTLSAVAVAPSLGQKRDFAAFDLESTQTKDRALVRGLTVESSLYVIFLVAAFFSRFWDLGLKALHHDESLHAYFSWVYATGGGYRHDPLMHGPFLFHITALFFLIFGDSDATSRYAPALFGVILVGLPYLLRGPRHLGRWGALTASFLFLISPSILYQSRYIRHDIFTITGTLLFFACIVRYIEKPERKWLLIGAASGSLLLTNHEIIFAILGIFALYLYGALVVGRCRAWYADRREHVYRLLGVHAAFVFLALVLYALVPKHFKNELLDIPWDHPTKQQQWEYYGTVVTNPLILGMLALIFGFIGALRYVFADARDAERRDEGWLPSLMGDAPEGTVEYSIRSVWKDRTGLAIGLFIAAVIFVALFTSLFTNLDGLVTSTIGTDGTLLYWLGQHDVRRGEQPWFYFLLLMPQYEFIAVLFGGAMTLLTGWRALLFLFNRGSGGRNLFFRLFIAVWLVLLFIGLSYAGEKMPWLVVHIALPATLLAAAMIGGLIERAAVAIRNRRANPIRSLVSWAEWGLLIALLIAGAAWAALAGRLTFGQFVELSESDHNGWRRTLTSYDARHWWLLAVPPAVAFVLLGAHYLFRGPRRTGLTALAAITIGLSLLQIHAGWRLSYQESDVPRDMLVYTQTSPDVTRLMSEIDALSEEMTGGKNLKVWYDSGVSWPMQWYLRDYPNKEFKGTTSGSNNTVSGDVPIIINSRSCAKGFEDAYSGYTAQEYVLRWWFPEEEYRDFAIAPELPPGRSALKSSEDPHGVIDIIRSIGDTLGHELTPEGQLRLYRLMMYRDLDWANGQCNFQVYIRNDLLPLFNGIRY